MSGDMVAVIRALPLKEWDAFFETRVLAKAMQIEACTLEKLPSLKAEISQIREIQSHFKEQWNRHSGN